MARRQPRYDAGAGRGSIRRRVSSLSIAHKNLFYGPSDDPQRRLDLYLPETGGDWPLLIYLHGGAWITGSKDEYSETGERLAGMGIAAAIVDYRLSTEGGVRHPAHVEDCAQAIGWLRDGAVRYGWNPGRMFVAGHSAGAHIAALIASAGQLRLAGYVGFAGIYDLVPLVQRFPEYRERFMTKAFGADEGGWAEASPISLPFESSAPWLLMHSSADELVNPGQSQRFCEHLESNGVPVRLVVLPDGSHYEAARSIGQAGVVTDELMSFLSSS